jgi:AcrR family transcriptional regulator
MVPASSNPRRREPAHARRAQILAAALRCFSEKGYHATTTEDLVRASGLSKGSLYWHFRSKEEVFLALLEALEGELFSAWEQAAVGSVSVLDGLRLLGELTLEKLLAQRALLRAWPEFITHPAGRERFAQTYRSSRERLAAWVRRGIESGELRELPVEGVAVAMTAAVEGLLLQAMVDPGFDARTHWPHLWEILHGGIAR